MNRTAAPASRAAPRLPFAPLAAVLLVAGLGYEAVLLFTSLLAPYRFPIPYAVPIFDAPFALVGIGVAYLCLERHRLLQDFQSVALGTALFLAALLGVAHVLTQPDYPGTPGIHAGVAPYFFFLSYLAGLVGIGLSVSRGSHRPLALSDGTRFLVALGTGVLAGCLIMGVLRARPLLPSLVMAPGRLTPFAIATAGIATGATGLWALWRGRRAASRRADDPFAVFLLVAAVIWLLGLLGLLIAPYRYGVSWYVAGLARPIGVGMVFVALIREQVNLYRDKTRLYAELEANLAQLQETQAQLLQADKLAALGTLLSGMAHELNNPLSTISLTVQLAKQKPGLPESLRARLDVVELECDRALRIIRDLLLLARRNPPERTRVDLNGIVRATLELHAAEFERQGIHVVTNLENVPPIWADPYQIQQVLLNLFTNATHAMKTSHGRGELMVRSSREGGNVQIEVEDDGPGIPAEHLGRIFDPFFTTKSADEGTGLGLSLSIGIVEAHGGRMSAESVAGQGALFKVRLPIGSNLESGTADPVPTRESGRRARILVVDDEDHLRGAVVDVLSGAGHEVQEAATGRAAMAQIAAGNYDVITLDLRLPDVDGTAVWEWLLARDPSMAARVVFMTGDTMNPDTQAFLQGTGRPVLAKPFTVECLLGAVEAALPARSAQALRDRS